MSGVAAGFFLVAAVLVLLWATLEARNATAIQAACPSGVQQIYAPWLAPLKDGDVFVVCKDGSVKALD